MDPRRVALSRPRKTSSPRRRPRATEMDDEERSATRRPRYRFARNAARGSHRSVAPRNAIGGRRRSRHLEAMAGKRLRPAHVRAKRGREPRRGSVVLIDLVWVRDARRSPAHWRVVEGRVTPAALGPVEAARRGVRSAITHDSLALRIATCPGINRCHATAGWVERAGVLAGRCRGDVRRGECARRTDGLGLTGGAERCCQGCRDEASGWIYDHVGQDAPLTDGWAAG